MTSRSCSGKMDDWLSTATDHLRSLCSPCVESPRSQHQGRTSTAVTVTPSTSSCKKRTRWLRGFDFNVDPFEVDGTDAFNSDFCSDLLCSPIPCITSNSEGAAASNVGTTHSGEVSSQNFPHLPLDTADKSRPSISCESSKRKTLAIAGA